VLVWFELGFFGAGLCWDGDSVVWEGDDENGLEEAELLEVSEGDEED
jgi:hypothetical protein